MQLLKYTTQQSNDPSRPILLDATAIAVDGREPLVLMLLQEHEVYTVL